MALNKVTYTDDVTVIEAQNMNDIQDEIISVKSYTTISSATDLNSLTNYGHYRVPNATLLTNAPTGMGSSGTLDVDVASNYIKQTLCLDGGISTRFSYDNGSTWATWKSIVPKETGGSFAGNVFVDKKSGTTALSDSYLVAGNSTPNGTVGNSRGIVELFSEQSYYVNIYPRTLTGNRSLYVPDATGTIALQENISSTPMVIGNFRQYVLYRKLIEGTFPATISGSTAIANDPVLRVSNLIRIDGTFWNNAGSGFPPSGYYASSVDWAVVYPQGGSLFFVTGRPNVFQGQTFRFIVDYIQ